MNFGSLLKPSFFLLLMHIKLNFQSKAKGVEALIAIENPNRVQKKAKKLAAITPDDNPQLSRRERYYYLLIRSYISLLYI